MGRTRPPDRVKAERGKRDRLPGDYRIYRLSLREWLYYGGLGILGCGLAAYVFYRSFLAFGLLLPIGLSYPLYKKRELRERRLRQLTTQFREGILVLSSFLSAGYSVENSFAMSIQELEGLYGAGAMITEEFQRILAGIRVNRPAEALLTELGERSGLGDIDHFAQIFAVARRSGGELVEIIDHTAGILRDKGQVQEEIYTMTASRVFEQKVMNAVPFLIVLYIDATSPGFFREMYVTWLGRAVMTACLLLYGSGVLLAKHILAIEL